METHVKKYGYSYHVTREQIEAYQKLPIKERLRWLEEARGIYGGHADTGAVGNIAEVSER